ncbi:MAG: phosphoglycerate dehydrogenase, partial [Cyclobacteriaceae bacterium]
MNKATGDTYFVIDFDSTFTKVEALDILCEISLEKSDSREENLNRIKEITDLGMLGEISFRESLEERISLLHAHRDHLPELVDRLSNLVSESFTRNKKFIADYSEKIFILSNGFKDFIVPVVKPFGIKPENVYA